ncbi:MAG: response regulator [Spirochaetia bacterium]|jgi:PAS domain S-box-containing protein
MRVMYVADDPLDVELLSQALQEAEPGVQIDTAGSLADARTMLEAADPDYSPYDVLLADVGLPDGSGLSLVPLVRDRHLPIAVVVLTSSGGEEAAVAALRSGANDFMVKRGDYLQRLPAVIQDALTRQAVEQIQRTNPLRLLYATASSPDLEQMLRQFSRFAPHIHLEVVRSALDVMWRLVGSRAAGEHASCDVLLIDDRLGGTNAIELLKVLREQGELTVPVVVAADQGDEEIAVQALRLGAADYVVKDASYLRRLPTVIENVYFRAQISKEKQALAASMQTMRAMIDSSPLSIISIDARGKVQSWNPAATHMFGWTRAETLGGPIPFLPGEKAGDFKGFLARTLAGTPVTNVESRRARRDGTPVDISISTAPLRDARGKITGAIWMVSDITERRRDEEKIAEQARLLDFALDAIIVRGSDERLLYCNAAAVKLYGYSLEELCSMPTTDLVVPEDIDRFEEARRLLAARGEWEGELRQRTSDGAIINVHSRWSLVRDTAGFPQARLIINRDISRQRELEKQLRRTQRMESLGTLASGIAHDLNNILSPVMMSVDMLRTRYTEPSDQQMLQILETSIQRGSEIVRQMLSFARGSEGELVPLQLRHVTREIDGILRESFPKNIAITTDVPKDLPLVLGDATQLHQILINLCVNSRDALPNGGNIVIRARAGTITAKMATEHAGAKPGPCVVLSVFDDGAGIPAGIQDRIFDPFFTTKEKGKGTGLGLSTVDSIVRGHGGVILFKSAEGSGTQFDVFLPAVAEAAKQEADEPGLAIPLGMGETILVIDDDVSILQITRQILESYDYKVISANSGTLALETVAQGLDSPIHLILTDLDMPSMGGAAMVSAFRKAHGHVPVVIMSGLPPSKNSREVEHLDVQGIIGKPFKAEDLLTLVRDVLDA